MTSKEIYKKMEKRILIERDEIWYFNKFSLLTFVTIRYEYKTELRSELHYENEE